jgi:hypothetical protein
LENIFRKPFMKAKLEFWNGQKKHRGEKRKNLVT